MDKESFMSKIKWRIIKINLGDGTTEYQVSDGDVGERTVSYDFDNRLDAENWILSEDKPKEDKTNG